MLIPTFVLGDLDLTSAPYLVEFGSDLGAPENVYEVVLSLLRDGDSVASDRAGNREITLTVIVEGANLRDLALAEAALIAETEKPRNVLTINPGDGVGASTAFDTFRAQATLVRSDDEEQHYLRRYEVTIPALPHARSTSKVVTVTQPVVATPTYATLDTLDSAAGWTGSKKWPGFTDEAAVTPTSSGGALVVSKGTSEHPRVIDPMTTATLSAYGSAVTVAVSNGANVITSQTSSGSFGVRWAPANGATMPGPYLVFEITTGANGSPYGNPPVQLACQPSGGGETYIVTPSSVQNAPGGAKYYFFAPPQGVVMDLAVLQIYFQSNLPAYSTVATVHSAFTATSTAVGSFGTGLTVSRATPYAMQGFPYIIAEWQTSGASPLLSLTASGSAATMISDKALPDGWRRTVWRVNGDPTVSFRAEAEGLTDLRIRELIRTDSPEGVGSPRQQNLTIEVGGSVRTQGDIRISHTSGNGMGDVIVYTYPSGSGAQPPLRPWRVSGDTITSDSGMVSGARNTLSGVTTFRIPVKSLLTGSAQLWARVYSTTTTPTFSWSVASYRSGGYGVVGPTLSGTTKAVVTASTYTLVPIADLILPPTKVGPDGSVQITLQASGGTVTLDEAWLFNLEEGDLTVVTGTTGVADSLWIDAPSLDKPLGGIEVGQARADAFYPGGGALSVLSAMDHNFAPDGTSVFVVTTGTLTASASLEHFRRWHTHAAD